MPSWPPTSSPHALPAPTFLPIKLGVFRSGSPSPELPWQMNQCVITIATKKKERASTNISESTRQNQNRVKKRSDHFYLLFRSSPSLTFPFPSHQISPCKNNFFIVEESINRDKKIGRSGTCATDFHATSSWD